MPFGLQYKHLITKTKITEQCRAFTELTNQNKVYGSKELKPTQIRIKNYRSITSEITITLSGETTIVGPNSSGKTNIISAVQTFFCGIYNNPYNIDEDLPRGSNGAQTSIIVNFHICRDNDSHFHELYRQMLSCLEDSNKSDENIPLFLYFTSTGKPVYKFFSNDKIKTKLTQLFKTLHEEALNIIINGFSCKYIPSEKNSDYIYKEILLPFLRSSIAGVLQPYISRVKEKLSEISESLNTNLASSGLEEIKVSFEIPDQKIEKSLSFFDFQIDDGLKMPARNKGSGIQTTALLSALHWIADQERELGRETIWLLEEPESYLHPHLASSCSTIIQKLSKNSTVIVTTHSISFVSQNPISVFETEFSLGSTQIKTFSTYSKATASIRSALGLRYSDFHNLGKYNILVEGESDRELLQWALGIIKPNKTQNHFTNTRKSAIMDFTGVTTLKDFLKHSYELIRHERPTYIIFDGDKAGADASCDLLGYFGKKQIPFTANKDYSVLPNGLPIEGLFPHAWIKKIYDEHPSWFKSFNIDLEGKIIALTVKDDKKKNLQSSLMKLAEEETEKSGNYVWGKSFVLLFKTIEEALSKKGNLLYGERV